MTVSIHTGSHMNKKMRSSETAGSVDHGYTMAIHTASHAVATGSAIY